MTMPLRFHWSMSSAGVRLKGATARAAQSGVPDLAAYIEYGRHAERCGIESLLTAIGFHRPDPLILATAIGVQTESITFMIALRSGVASPTLVVQQINSLSAVLGGRICLNIVAGHTPAEQRGYGDFLEHDARYARTDEFLQVCRALWEQSDPVDFFGRALPARGRQAQHAVGRSRVAAAHLCGWQVRRRRRARGSPRRLPVDLARATRGSCACAWPNFARPGRRWDCSCR